MSRKKLAYLLSVTGVGAAAFAYGIKNNSFEPLKNKGSEFLNWKDDSDLEFQSSWHNHSRIIDSDYTQNITFARDLVMRFKDEVGAPGMVIGVSVDGETVWSEGMGMADVENRVPCHAETVMRIASISKSMTMAILAKLWEDGKIDLDKPIQEYVPNFPVKKYDGKEVTITTRMLASHLAGIRHYFKKGETEDGEKPSDTLCKEFYLKDKFDNVEDALKLFQDDELLSEPGTTYLYSTHGYTLLSAVIEGVTKEPFTKSVRHFFKTLGLANTYLDENNAIIYHRARYYSRNKKGRLTNVPFTDNSYKWAGGGLLSNVKDLLHFCNAMLVSYQYDSKLGDKLSFLKPSTVQALWTPASKESYGLGWAITPYKHDYLGGSIQSFSVSHSGGAVGASSIVLMLPREKVKGLPSGVAVAIITNLQDVGMRKLATEVAEVFMKE